jgi:HEAT repeat protein
MKRFLIGLTFSLALALPASAAPSAKVEQQVQVLLSAPEHVPTAAEWQKLGPDAADVLRTVALDSKTLVLKRGRAAAALGFFKSESSKQVLIAIAADTKAPWLLRGKAARTLASSWQNESLPVVQPLFSSDNKRRRAAAVKALGLVPTKESRQLLTSRSKVEKDAYVRDLIAQTLERVAPKGGSR